MNHIFTRYPLASTLLTLVFLGILPCKLIAQQQLQEYSATELAERKARHVPVTDAPRYYEVRGKETEMQQLVPLLRQQPETFLLDWNASYGYRIVRRGHAHLDLDQNQDLLKAIPGISISPLPELGQWQNVTLRPTKTVGSVDYKALKSAINQMYGAKIVGGDSETGFLFVSFSTEKLSLSDWQKRLSSLLGTYNFEPAYTLSEPQGRQTVDGLPKPIMDAPDAPDSARPIRSIPNAVHQAPGVAPSSNR